jgi:hypothetical protein
VVPGKKSFPAISKLVPVISDRPPSSRGPGKMWFTLTKNNKDSGTVNQTDYSKSHRQVMVRIFLCRPTKHTRILRVSIFCKTKCAKSRISGERTHGRSVSFPFEPQTTYCLRSERNVHSWLLCVCSQKAPRKAGTGPPFFGDG